MAFRLVLNVQLPHNAGVVRGHVSGLLMSVTLGASSQLR